MVDLIICPTCEEAPRSLRSKLRVNLVEILAAELNRIRRAAKRVHEQYVADGGYGQTLAFEDAIRELEAALASQQASDANAKGGRE